jgi:hypothetical protein
MQVPNGQAVARPKYFFLSHPRTGSVLLMRMLSHQPRLTQGEHFLTTKMDMMIENSNGECREASERQKYISRLQQGFNRLVEFVSAFAHGEDKFKAIYASRAEPLASGVSTTVQVPPEVSMDILHQRFFTLGRDSHIQRAHLDALGSIR